MIMPIDPDDLVKRVMDLTGINQPASAAVALEATLEALGERLTSGDASRLADALPPRLSAALLRLRRHTGAGLPALFARISVCEGVRLGVAIEHAQAVGRALAEALGLEERLLLQRRLPPDWAALFADAVQPAIAEVHPPLTSSGQGHTLADGKPGSRHPLSEMRWHPATSGAPLAVVGSHDDTNDR
jgi:uncharacterized protein (DUF2267 family)